MREENWLREEVANEQGGTGATARVTGPSRATVPSATTKKPSVATGPSGATAPRSLTGPSSSATIPSPTVGQVAPPEAYVSQVTSALNELGMVLPPAVVRGMVFAAWRYAESLLNSAPTQGSSSVAPSSSR